MKQEILDVISEILWVKVIAVSVEFSELAYTHIKDTTFIFSKVELTKFIRLCNEWLDEKGYTIEVIASGDIDVVFKHTLDTCLWVFNNRIKDQYEVL